MTVVESDFITLQYIVGRYHAPTVLLLIQTRHGKQIGCCEISNQIVVCSLGLVDFTSSGQERTYEQD